jgi:hypothetical protein
MQVAETEVKHRDTKFTETHREEIQATDCTENTEAAGAASAVTGLRPADRRAKRGAADVVHEAASVRLCGLCASVLIL